MAPGDLHGGAVVGQDDIIAGGNGQAQNILLAVLLEDRHHGKGIGPADAVPVHITDKLQDLGGHGAGVLRVDFGDYAVGGHNTGQQVPIHQILIGNQASVLDIFLVGIGNSGCHVVVVGLALASGVMLAAGHIAVALIHLTNNLSSLANTHGIIGEGTVHPSRAVAVIDVDDGTPGSIVAGGSGVGDNSLRKYLIVFGLVAGRQGHQRDLLLFRLGVTCLGVADDDDGIVRNLLDALHKMRLTGGNLDTADHALFDQIDGKINVRFLKGAGAVGHTQLLLQGQFFKFQMMHAVSSFFDFPMIITQRFLRIL